MNLTLKQAYIFSVIDKYSKCQIPQILHFYTSKLTTYWHKVISLNCQSQSHLFHLNAAGMVGIPELSVRFHLVDQVHPSEVYR